MKYLHINQIELDYTNTPENNHRLANLLHSHNLPAVHKSDRVELYGEPIPNNTKITLKVGPVPELTIEPLQHGLTYDEGTQLELLNALKKQNDQLIKAHAKVVTQWKLSPWIRIVCRRENKELAEALDELKNM